MQTFFFYDLETSGFNPREQRIMQFAGQRTDLNLKTIGKSYDCMLALNPDVLPDPDAVMVTGITPQKTQEEGITEAEFLTLFHKEIATPGTIFVGYNTIRFDDEFMRFLHYRNFYDPYEWHWQNGKSRWDLLDVVRMTRALRPEGIKWPVDSDGRPTNRLELITGLNGLDHQKAHDALNDVLATIAVAKLIRQKQQKLFDYLLTMRDKKKVEELVSSNQPFVYASGKYSSETEKTTVVVRIADNPKSGALVYDLRHDPEAWLAMSPEKLADAWRWKKDSTEPRLPIKTLQYNRCPAVAPVGVLDDDSKARLKIDIDTIDKNRKKVLAASQFTQNVLKALDILNRRQQMALLTDEQLVDTQLYDAFFDNSDKPLMKTVREADAKVLDGLKVQFKDKRLNGMLPLYKARNFPSTLSEEEREKWQQYCHARLLDGGDKSRAFRYFKRLGELAENRQLTQNQRYLLEELQLYGQSILPEQS